MHCISLAGLKFPVMRRRDRPAADTADNVNQRVPHGEQLFGDREYGTDMQWNLWRDLNGAGWGLCSQYSVGPLHCLPQTPPQMAPRYWNTGNKHQEQTCI